MSWYRFRMSWGPFPTPKILEDFTSVKNTSSTGLKEEDTMDLLSAFFQATFINDSIMFCVHLYFIHFHALEKSIIWT
jgi:hypothetical protein